MRTWSQVGGRHKPRRGRPSAERAEGAGDIGAGGALSIARHASALRAALTPKKPLLIASWDFYRLSSHAARRSRGCGKPRRDQAVGSSVCAMVSGAFILGACWAETPSVRRSRRRPGLSPRDRLLPPAIRPRRPTGRCREQSCRRARAASTPAGEVSATKHRVGSTPSAAAAKRKISGSGLPRVSSRPQSLALNMSNRLLPAAHLDRPHHLVGILR